MRTPLLNDRRQRTGIIVLATLFLAVGMLSFSGVTVSETEYHNEEIPPSPLRLDYKYFAHITLDTLYVLDTCYIEVRLDSQIVVQHCRSGIERRIPCSSGNAKINKAIETPEGLYNVQSKSPMAYSRQFDSTKMYFWVGFNGNIGFHGLDGKNYYRFLGKRPSSHGCIRLSTEDAEWMFHNIAIGTPVLVHSGESARYLKMVDTLPNDAVNIQNMPYIRRALQHNLTDLYGGRYFINPGYNLYFSQSHLWWGGIAVGDVKRIPPRQKAQFIAE